MNSSAGLLFKKYLCFTVGMACVAFGVALSASTRLGTSPISSIAYVAHRISVVREFHPVWTLGATSFVLNVIFFLFQWGIERKDFFRRQFLQLPATFVFGVFIDGFAWVIGDLSQSAYAIRVGSSFLSAFIVALGIIFELAANVLYLPGDGMVKTLASALKTPFGMTKTCFDVFLTVASIIASVLAVGYIEGVREGTVIGAIMVGQFARLLRPLTGKLRRKCGFESAETVSEGKGKGSAQ